MSRQNYLTHPGDITPDTSNLLKATMIIQLILQLLSIIFSFTHHSKDAWTNSVYLAILDLPLLSQLPRISKRLTSFLILSKFVLDVAMPASFFLVTFQQMLGFYTVHDLLFLPTVLRYMTIILFVISITLTVFIWLYLKEHEESDITPDSSLYVQTDTLRKENPAVFAVDPDLFSRLANEHHLN
ncbi:hypothetical protein BLNAU_3632 [Blattamonas nauphoetae]|uniref:Uncharacterized protein n=1 Tax=Blattamonas nauphoetae TaxID=2049346 RepID=A0ABQ9YCM5_9EUKA|nr:hypothetical protein BLNAU_3632 [Blattamonas nauphoetae]